MIEEKLLNEANRFRDDWNSITKPFPVLQLDGTWPSVGVLDLLLMRMMGRDDFLRFEENLLKGAACYLGVLVHECWSKFGVSLSLTLDRKRGATIVAEGGAFLEQGERNLIYIEQVLRKVVTEIPNPLPVISDFSRVISEESNMIEATAFGIASGLYVPAEGKWSTLSLEELGEYVDSFVKTLAASSAKWYARVFPEEKIGQVGELYLGGLTYPPMLMKESTPACVSSLALIEFAKQYTLSESDLLQVAENLSQSPLEQHSLAGIVVYAALTDLNLSPKVIERCAARSNYIGFLRPALVGARRALGKGEDWLLREAFDEEARERFRIEDKLCFFSWLELPEEKVGKKEESEKFQDFLLAITEFDYDRCFRRCEELIEEDPSDVDLRVQKAALLIRAEAYGEAEGEFRKAVSEPGSDSHAGLYEMWGLLNLSRGDVESAERRLRLSFGFADTREKTRISQNLAWALMCAGSFEEASEKLDFSIASGGDSIAALLNRRVCLLELEKPMEEVHELDERLFSLLPQDRRAFSLILTNEYLKRLPLEE